MKVNFRILGESFLIVKIEGTSNSAIAELETADSPAYTALSAILLHRTGEYASVVLMASGLVFQATYAVYPKIQSRILGYLPV